MVKKAEKQRKGAAASKGFSSPEEGLAKVVSHLCACVCVSVFSFCASARLCMRAHTRRVRAHIRSLSCACVALVLLRTLMHYLPTERPHLPARTLPLLTLQLQVSETMSETLGASAGSLGASAGTGMARPDTRANRPQSIDVNAQTQTNKKKSKEIN